MLSYSILQHYSIIFPRQFLSSKSYCLFIRYFFKSSPRIYPYLFIPISNRFNIIYIYVTPSPLQHTHFIFIFPFRIKVQHSFLALPLYGLFKTFRLFEKPLQISVYQFLIGFSTYLYTHILFFLPSPCYQERIIFYISLQ